MRKGSPPVEYMKNMHKISPTNTYTIIGKKIVCTVDSHFFTSYQGTHCNNHLKERLMDEAMKIFSSQSFKNWVVTITLGHMFPTVQARHCLLVLKRTQIISSIKIHELVITVEMRTTILPGIRTCVVKKFTHPLNSFPNLFIILSFSVQGCGLQGQQGSRLIKGYYFTSDNKFAKYRNLSFNKVPFLEIISLKRLF